MRNIFRLSLLAAVAAVLLCTVPVFAKTGCADPESFQEAILTPELAIELGLPETVEMQTAAKLLPHCAPDETLQVCDITDPCTGQNFWDATCCPAGTQGVCLIGITRDGCFTSARAICLGIVSP